jgi:uncharacterized protein YbjT (DUF2867 family)
VVEASRSQGVDLVSGRGLSEALRGADVVIDVSNPLPADDPSDIMNTLSAASQNLVGACALHEIQRLVVLSIAGLEKPVFDEFPYYAAKRAAKEIVLDSSVPATIVKSTQWHEIATQPTAVSYHDDEVVAEDWLIQPIAADVVADVLVEAALAQTRTPRTVTGPQRIRLPELTCKLLAAHHDGRRVRTVRPSIAAFAEGALLERENSIILGPDVDTWLDSQTTVLSQQTPV